MFRKFCGGILFEGGHLESREGNGKRKLVTPEDAENLSNFQQLPRRTQNVSLNNNSGLHVRHA
jgi:hypothetical protein